MLEIISVLLIVIRRLRTEIQHHIGKEEPEFCHHIVSQLEILEWGIKELLESNRLDKATIH